MSELKRNDCDSVKPPDPVHSHPDSTWWFYEETWADENGPYSTEEECRTMLLKYCREVLGVHTLEKP
jgi:hypothetical protein